MAVPVLDLSSEIKLLTFAMHLGQKDLHPWFWSCNFGNCLCDVHYLTTLSIKHPFNVLTEICIDIQRSKDLYICRTPQVVTDSQGTVKDQ